MPQLNSILGDLGFDSLTVVITDGLQRQIRIFAAKTKAALDKVSIFSWMRSQPLLSHLPDGDWRALQNQLADAGFGVLTVDLLTIRPPGVRVQLL